MSVFGRSIGRRASAGGQKPGVLALCQTSFVDLIRRCGTHKMRFVDLWQI